MFLKTIRQAQFEANVKVKLPSAVEQCVRRLKYFARFSTCANACVDCHRLCRSSVKHGELECKHVLTVQIIFLSEMDVNKVRYRRNWRDNYLVSETVSQLCNN